MDAFPQESEVLQNTERGVNLNKRKVFERDEKRRVVDGQLMSAAELEPGLFDFSWNLRETRNTASSAQIEIRERFQ